MNVKFVDYVLIPGEKHLGIASVIVDDKFLFRFKAQPGKDGKGMYFQPASHKMPDESYVPSFVIDSNFLKEAIETCIRNGIKQKSTGFQSHYTPATSLPEEQELPF